MDASSPSLRSSATDSPWFWFCCFCTAGLAALVLIQPKYGARQAQLEQQFQGRQFASQSATGPTAEPRFSDERTTLIKLDWLYWVMTGGLALAWFAFWRQQWRRHGSGSPNRSECEGLTGDIARPTS